AAFSESKSKGKNRNFVARSKRSRRGRTAGRSRHHDQLAERSRVYAQYGYAWTSRGTFTRNARLPGAARAFGFRFCYYSDRGHRPGGDAISNKWTHRSDGVGDESGLRQPVAVAKNRDA